jgi:hypothetical protein
MKGLILVLLFAAFTLTACIVSPGPPGYGGAVVVPPLPAIVELGADPYYYQNGYYYFNHNNNWRYSQSRSGPWMDLPRSHWPNEIRYRDRDNDRDRGRDVDRQENGNQWLVPAVKGDRDRDFREEHDRR